MGGRYVAAPRDRLDPSAAAWWLVRQPATWIAASTPVVALELRWSPAAGFWATLVMTLAATLVTLHRRRWSAAAETLERVRWELDRRLQEVRAAAAGGTPAAPPSWPRLLVVVDEVAELTCRDLGDDRAARAAQQAASGRLCEIARQGRSVGVHLVCCTQRPDAEAVPGQLKANLAGTVAFRVRAAVNSYILLDSDRAAPLPPHPGRAIWQEDSAEEFQAVDCSLEESRDLLLARWSGRGLLPPRVLVSQWWQSTCPTSDELSDPS